MNQLVCGALTWLFALAWEQSNALAKQEQTLRGDTLLCSFCLKLTLWTLQEYYYYSNTICHLTLTVKVTYVFIAIMLREDLDSKLNIF